MWAQLQGPLEAPHRLLMFALKTQAIAHDTPAARGHPFALSKRCAAAAERKHPGALTNGDAPGLGRQPVNCNAFVGQVCQVHLALQMPEDRAVILQPLQ